MLLGGNAEFPRGLIEISLRQRQQALQRRSSINNGWERETGRGIQHSFGEYKVRIEASSSHQREEDDWKNEEITIQEDCSSIATRVWDNATLTVKWLQRRLQHQRQRQQQLHGHKISSLDALAKALQLDLEQLPSPSNPIRVLELGSGMGLLSIALAKMGAAVMATEYGSETVRFLNKNCEENNVALSGTPVAGTMVPGRVHCRELDWYTTNETLQSLQVATFDLIVVTDCSLTTKDSAGVLDMLHRFGTPGHTKVIVGVCKEREGTPYFVKRARNEFQSVRVIPESEYHQDFQSRRHSILYLCL